mgnify:FL=1
MKKVLIGLAVLSLAACGSDGGGDDAAEPEQESTGTATAGDGEGVDSDDSPDGGAIVSPQPAGRAFVDVDGVQYTMQEPGALDCTITDEAITFSFRMGDNEVTLGAGANLYDTGWLGSITLNVANPEGEPGPISYFPDLAADGDALVIDGNSASYSGPMQKQPANDGSNPAPVDVGDGVISVTCP